MTLAFNLALIAFAVALVAMVVALVAKHRAVEIAATALLAAGAVALTIYMGLRWHAAGRAPFSNMFESLVLFAWTIAAVYLAIRTRVRVTALGAAAALLAALVLAYASAFESDIRPLVPALRSNWLSVHVFTCFLGYGGFAVSALGAVSYLIVRDHGPREVLETIVARTIAFGFLFLTAGIVTGSVWANSAWGTYWSWDPKETWSLVTWLIYAVFLHGRFTRGWRGRVAAWISLVGFAAVLFTYFGVNYLLPSLHSYARQ
jgi:ABC-type transport system involved in cytochrome c biogenesis permease subunit